MPTETPEYIMDTHKDLEKCKGELIKAYGTIYTLETATQMAEESMQERANRNKMEVLGYIDMFKKRYRKALAASCLLAFLYQFCGVNYFSVYSTAIFDDMAGIGKEVSFASGVALLATSIFTPLFMTKFGRKPLITIGSFFAGASYLLIIVGLTSKTTWLMKVGVILYQIIFAISFGATVTAYLGEALPPSGVGISLGIIWVCASLLGLLLPIIRPKVGDLPLLLFFMTICFVFSLVMYLVLVESKGKSQNQITDEFEARNLFSFKKGFEKTNTQTKVSRVGAQQAHSKEKNAPASILNRRTQTDRQQITQADEVLETDRQRIV